MTMYGFWLPNDPRGSWSAFVRAWELFRFGGPATKTNLRRSLARDAHDVAMRLEMKKHLARDPVLLNGLQARAVARGFARFVQTGIIVRACAILPDHVHFVILRHSYSIERIATLLKGAATAQLIREGLHPFQDQPYRDESFPTPWVRRWWKVFLDSDEDIVRASGYVEDNPLTEGFPKQRWSFVAPLRGLYARAD